VLAPSKSARFAFGFFAMSFILQTSFLGDTILSLPFLHECLRLEEKDSHVWIAAPRNKAIVELALERGLKSRASRVELMTYDKRKDGTLWAMHRYAGGLRESHPEQKRIYCLQRSFRNGLLAFLSGIPERVGFATGSASFFYTDCAPREWDSFKNEVEKNLELLRHVHPGKVPEWNARTAPTLLRDPAKTRKPRKETLALSLTSPWPTKEWSFEQARAFMETIVGQGWEVLLLGDEKSRAFNDALFKAVPSKLVQNLSGATPIKDWVDIIDSCEVLVSGDSAAVHVASDLGVPVVALFGPTHPSFGFAPWRRNARVLGIELPCRPCHIHGPRQCPLKHHNCMRLLSAKDVVEAVLRLTA
jgi:heptosyltransferase-2